MYINYNGTKYPCRCRPGATMIYHGLPDNFPTPVSGEIVLCADDDFILRTDVAEDYLRQMFEDGVLTLTNVAEEPAPVVAELTPADHREDAYNTEPVILWEGEYLTVTQAAQKWQYYAAEGDMEQAGAITSLIAQAKKEIRAQYPDEEAMT